MKFHCEKPRNDIAPRSVALYILCIAPCLNFTTEHASFSAMYLPDGIYHLQLHLGKVKTVTRIQRKDIYFKVPKHDRVSYLLIQDYYSQLVA